MAGSPIAAAGARSNNFDLLRLVFAGAVVCWHGYVLSGEPALAPLARWFSADLAVKAFFIVSGYLIAMSWEGARGPADYAEKRIRRVYPAYAAAVLGCAVLGIVLGPGVDAGFLRGLGAYLAANLAFLNFLAPTLPGVFEANPWREMNGALWTLKIEVMFYATLPFILLLARRFGAPATLGVLYALSIGYWAGLGALHESSGYGLWLQLQRQLPGQLCYFLAGVALYLYRAEAARSWPALLLAAAAAWLVQHFAASPFLATVLDPVWLGIAVMYAAVGLPHLFNAARFGDLSYGIYVLHFPVIQAAVAAGWFASNPWAAFGAACLATGALAWLSWHAVEKPFLARGSHYRRAAA